MPIPQPILDDRSYEQLRDELIRRIHVYNPEWTDRNPSDPGITLIELFAFLEENLLYRFNQIPEKTKLEYLRLLQIPLLPATPSRAMLSLSADKEEGVPVEKGSVAKAGRIVFSTENEVRALPVSVTAISKEMCEAPKESDDPEVYAWYRNSIDALGGLAEGQDVCFENRIVPGEGNGESVDFAKSVDGMIWIAVFNESKLDVDKMREALAGKKDTPIFLNIGFVPDPFLSDGEKPASCPGCCGSDAASGGVGRILWADGERVTGVTGTAPAVDWEISRVRREGEVDNDPAAPPVFKTLKVVGDTTGGLTKEGVVRLSLPVDVDDMGPYAPDDEALAGTGDLPPALEEGEDKLLFWLRAFHHGTDGSAGALGVPDGGEGSVISRFGKIRLITANAVAATQQKKARPFFLGTGNGQPNQEYALAHTPVVAGSLVLEVEEDTDSWTMWEEVDGFHGSHEGSRHYTLDRESGTVRFGNGLSGLPPRLGWRIRSVSYRYGGGAKGNVPAKAIGKLPGKSGVTVVNHLAARGGADTETLEKALERIPGELRRKDRAVTSGDFKELALIAPGANVGRAETVARFHPGTRNREAAGVVTVIIWPRDDPEHPDAPLPDRNMIETVCRYLDERRLVTTELYVIEPVYRKVAVSVGLKVKPGYGIEAVRNWVELVIRQYLAPLPPYGPEGGGWPLGRRVHGPELEAAALQVEGVEYLEGLTLAGWNGESETWEEGTVGLAVDEVPELSEITVVEGERLPPPGTAVSPPERKETPVPVPVLRCDC